MSVLTVQWVLIVQMTPGTRRIQPRLISTDGEIEIQLGELLSLSPENLDAHKCPRDPASLGGLAEIVSETSSVNTQPCFPRRPTCGLKFSKIAKESHHQEAKSQRVYQEKAKDLWRR
jgi:hypothetical protein